MLCPLARISLFAVLPTTLLAVAACGGGGETGGASTTATGGAGTGGDTTTTSTTTTTTTGTTTSGPPPMPTPSDPVTVPLTSAECSGKIHAVASDADLDAVPWASLKGGDCVNIQRTATPYTHKFCLAAAATAAAPVVIHGVTDASGRRPEFDFGAATARTAPDCAKVFDVESQYDLETEGGIVITGPQFPSSNPTYNPPKPSFVRVENLDLHGATSDAQFTNLAGQKVPYEDLASAVYVQLGADITIQNCLLHDSNYGIFTQAKDDTLAGATERLTVRSCRVWGNGRANDYLTHNFYVQSTNPLIEGNYIGQTRPGSEGSSYKSRSSGEIFRFNYVVASARALDFVHSENDEQGILIQPDYGQAYVYGNIIVNDATTPYGAANVPIHFGGDNLGEDNEAAQQQTVEGSCAGCVPKGTYRSHLFFFSNLFWSSAGESDTGTVSIFEPSLQSTQVFAWDNLFSLHGSAYYSWLQHAGTVNVLGHNLAEVESGGKIFDCQNDAKEALWGGNKPVDTLFAVKLDPAGKLISAAPGFLSPGKLDFHLTPGAAAIGQATGVPASLPSNTPGYAKLSSLPVNQEPLMQTNGMAARASANDLGPEEH